LEEGSGDYLKYYNEKRPEYWERKEMIFQVACGLAYLEKKRIAHNDIKLENILCFENNKIFKISDFGFA
jgi:serine/threonine protein kinase